MNRETLTSIFQGSVILPEDEGYEAARRVFYGNVDKKPAVIVEVANAEDIKNAVALAKERGLELAIRSGGHSIVGFSSSEGGIVIDLHRMRGIEIDTDSKTVWAETGLTAGELAAELDKHNLVIGFGDTGSVGIGGITLGGGVGYLARKFGLAIDNLLAAEIVTANGELLYVDTENHPDLFWALRGGGGNFGVVTRFKYLLHELGECYGGTLLLPATPEVIAGFAELASKAPRELSTIANVMPAFPAPFVPEAFQGKVALMAVMVYAGPPEEGEKVVAPMRALAEPIADMLKPMRYKDIFPPENTDFHPTAVSRNMFIKNIDKNVAATALDWLNKVEAPVKAWQFRVLGGAVSDVASDTTAYAHRQSAVMCNIACFYQNESEKQTKQQWADDFAKALYQGDDAAYVNFLGPAEQDRLLDTYPVKTLKRLRKVKAQYDPENLFRLNFNILPESNA